MSMSTDSNRNKIAADCFKKCNEAMHKQNWDYAIDMATKAVRFVPDNLLYRQTLRGVEERKYNNNKTGAKMAGLKLTGIRTRITRARMKSDWQSLDAAAEDGLAVNPWEAQLNADLGEACHNLGYAEVAIFSYQRAVAGDPNNKGFLEKLANLLELRGSYKDAIDCWRRIGKIDPLDSQARSRATQLEAMNTMERGGYEGAQSTLDVKTGYDFDRGPKKTTNPDDLSGPGMSPEADLQRAIRKNPADKNNYLKLADLYTRERKLAEAGEVYKKALEVSGGDPNVRELFEDNELEQMRQQVKSAMEHARTDPVANKNYHDWKSELRKREIEVFSSRVERYPKDSSWKYKLATQYIKLKEYKKAIPLLQQSTADERIKGDALVALGGCFLADNNKLLARRQYETAIQVINPHDRTELFVEAQYALARLHEDAGDIPKAAEHYTEVLGLNYEYKDARERLERLQGGGG
ncbi:MAG: tetratricopeptide repeat protein [Planctomycetaceae bacterium]